MKLFDYIISKININNNVSKENLGNKVELLLGLNIHMSINIYNSLINKCNEIKLIEDFKTNDRNLRGKIEEQELNGEINLYKSNKNNYYKRFYNLLEQILDEIIKEDKDNLIDFIRSILDKDKIQKKIKMKDLINNFFF
jgi:hypothetical protein